MLRNTFIAVGVLIVIVGLWLLKLLYDAGVWRAIEPHFAGSCRLVPGPVGPEDLTIHPKTGVAYISSTDRRALQSGQPKPGAIWAYRWSDPAATPVNLTPDAGIDFQPHGISLWVGEDGRDLLFVVNHPAAASGKPRNTIEVFEVKAESLEHLRSLSDPNLLITPNDIVAVSPEHFYVTNTHAHPPGILQTLETYLRLQDARIVYFDGGKFRVALEGLLFPNGINTTSDGKRLWVASTTGGVVQEYERDPATEHLRLLRQIPAHSGLDNIEVDAAGDLWIGAHPKLLAVSRLLADPSTRSPSQVLHVETRTGAVEEIYLNDGTPISGSSVAARRDARLLIGQIVGEGVLDCTLTQPVQ
jgi:arylesterase/paraoxonase